MTKQAKVFGSVKVVKIFVDYYKNGQELSQNEEVFRKISFLDLLQKGFRVSTKPVRFL